ATAIGQQEKYLVEQGSRHKQFTFHFKDMHGQLYKLDFKIPQQDLIEARNDMPRLNDPRVVQSMQKAQDDMNTELIREQKRYLKRVVADINNQLPQGMVASIEFDKASYEISLKDTTGAGSANTKGVMEQISTTIEQHRA
ncbi:MAG: hypothetical protein CUN55_19345, partial [Phototrophicales bacterium]